MGIVKPMMGRTKRGSTPSNLERDIAYDYRRIVGHWIQDKRLKTGLTQQALGRALGISNTAVSAIELGRNTLSPERMGELADILGVLRHEFGTFMLRYTNPWMYALIYGEHDPTLKADLQNLPERLADNR
jgi:transcriptional regulator with XRE-family HTH domain